jgi:hypothetical protein
MRVALRELLPLRRNTENFDMWFGDQNAVYTISVGRYDDGRVGEVFITGAKIGSAMASVTHDAAVLLSIGLQYGVPLSTLRHAVSRDRDNKAATIVGAVIDIILEGETE